MEEKEIENLIYHTIPESLTDGVLAVDEKGKILLYNKRFIEIWDIPQEIIDSKSDERALSFVSEKLVNPQAFLEKVQYLYTAKTEKSKDEISLKDGRTLERYSSPILGNDGAYYGRAWYFRDISEQKNEEILAKDFVEKIKVQLLDIFPIVGKIPVEEVLKGEKKFQYLLSVMSDIFEILKERSIRLNDVRKAMLSLAEDVIGEKNKLVESYEQIREIIKSIGDAVVVINREKIITHFNPATEKITGWKAYEVVGKNYADFLHFYEDEAGEHPSKIIEDSISEGVEKKLGTKAVIKTKTGKIIPVLDVVSPLIDDKGMSYGCVVVFGDTSREREIDRAKSEFVSLASHQLRTPISASFWFTEMLLSGEVGELNEKQKDYVEEVLELNRRMEGNVSMLLNVSRIEMGTFIIESVPTEIGEIIDSSIALFQSLAKTKNITVKKEIENNFPVILADKKLLSLVLDNLASNSVHYTKNGGHVSIIVSKTKTDAVVEVTDDGVGILESEMPKICSKLYRTDAAKEMDANGTGIGLYITKSVVESWGGSIRVVSPVMVKTDSEGKEIASGTSFFVTIPLSGMRKKEGNTELYYKVK